LDKSEREKTIRKKAVEKKKGPKLQAKAAAWREDACQGGGTRRKAAESE